MPHLIHLADKSTTMHEDFSQPLRYNSPQAWVDAVMADFSTFLADHASAEKKASGMAVNMISHYPDRKALVDTMAEIAIEELGHYREVIKLIHSRDEVLGADAKDPYVVAFRKAIRQGKDEFFLDRLLIGGLIEARGAERFGLIAKALPEGKMKRFYQAITKSEERHHEVFFELAHTYFDADVVHKRLLELADIEAEICSQLVIRAALH